MYDWANQAILGTAKVDPAQVYSAAWKNDKEFATCGVKHVKAFTLNGTNLNGRKCSYAKSVGMIAMSCVSFVLNGVMLVGAADGSLIKFNGTSATKPIKHHNGAIWAIEPKDNKSFVTGGNDGKVTIWNAQMKPAQDFDMTTKLKFSPGIRSIDINQDGVRMLIGTRGSDVVEVNGKGKVTKTIVQGHFKGVNDKPEVWGLCTHPTEPKFASAGADKTIRIWETTKMINVSA